MSMAQEGSGYWLDLCRDPHCFVDSGSFKILYRQESDITQRNNNVQRSLHSLIIILQ